MPRNPPNRHHRQIPPKRTALVYCGGVRTEPAYLDALRLRFRASAVTVKVVGDGSDPTTLVRRAAAHRDRHTGMFDEVWCVTDVDQFDLAPAVDLARRKSVNLAVSNPCFELWLLLHHVDCTAHCANYHAVVTRLLKHVPGYDKTRLDFEHYAAGIGAAVDRAKKLDPTGKQFDRNPSTSMWRIVERVTANG